METIKDYLMVAKDIVIEVAIYGVLLFILTLIAGASASSAVFVIGALLTYIVRVFWTYYLEPVNE